MRREKVDLGHLAAELCDEMRHNEPGRQVDMTIGEGCHCEGDPRLLRILLQNLLENAWKYSARNPHPEIAFGRNVENGETVFFVRDNGVGFDMQYADRLFAPFQRLHPKEFGQERPGRLAHRPPPRRRGRAEPGNKASSPLHPGPQGRGGGCGRR
jgi:light-regulated signal transduction histidine kinase (bacteriophytochrome)